MSCMTKAMRRLNSSKRRGLAERVLAGLLGEVARELAADHAQQVEIFPVEPARHRRAAPAPTTPTSRS